MDDPFGALQQSRASRHRLGAIAFAILSLDIV
jgi:hypothetical protein